MLRPTPRRTSWPLERASLGISCEILRSPWGLIGAGLMAFGIPMPFTRSMGTTSSKAERLYEQAVGASAVDAASEAGEAVSEKAGEMVDAAKQSMREWSRDAADTVAVAGALRRRGGPRTSAVGARRARHDLTNQAAKVGSQVSAAMNAALSAKQAMSDLSDQVGRASATSRRLGTRFDFSCDYILSQPRDKVLLGVAGLAVAAALGMAYQKRVIEEVDDLLRKA